MRSLSSIKMFHRDTYCIMPWSSIQINPSGDYKICCFSGTNNQDHGMCVDEHENLMNVMTHSIKDALNSVNHKSLRLAQSKNQRHSLCQMCWNREDASKNNNRVSSLRFYRTFEQLPNLDNAVSLEKVEGVMNDDGSIDNIPISLDLRFTNVCNMKCIMCSSKYSNLWYEDEEKLYGQKKIFLDQKTYDIRVENGVYKTDMPVWHDSEQWWKHFDEVKHQVRHLYLTGGEPFIVKGHDVLLDKLIEEDLAKNIILEYDTNLSVVNDKILKRLSHFKEIIISVSCDDILERYELVRFPGNFNTLLSNLEKLKSRDIKIRHLSSCVGIYSIFAPIRLHEFFTKIGYEDFSLRFLRSPNHSDVALLPDDLKQEVITIYENSNLPTKYVNYVCNYLRNNMGKPTELCEESVRNHINYLDSLDNIRGTNWRETFPDVRELLKRFL